MVYTSIHNSINKVTEGIGKNEETFWVAFEHEEGEVTFFLSASEKGVELGLATLEAGVRLMRQDKRMESTQKTIVMGRLRKAFEELVNGND